MDRVHELLVHSTFVDMFEHANLQFTHLLRAVPPHNPCSERPGPARCTWLAPSYTTGKTCDRGKQRENGDRDYLVQRTAHAEKFKIADARKAVSHRMARVRRTTLHAVVGVDTSVLNFHTTGAYCE